MSQKCSQMTNIDDNMHMQNVENKIFLFYVFFCNLLCLFGVFGDIKRIKSFTTLNARCKKNIVQSRTMGTLFATL